MAIDGFWAVMLMGFPALMVVIANDYWKKRLVAKAANEGRPARKDLHQNETSRSRVVAVVVALFVTGYMIKHPELADREWGILKPLMQWFYSEPPSQRHQP